MLLSSYSGPELRIYTVVGNICRQYQHLCVFLSSVTGNKAGSERAKRCFTVSAGLHYHTISNKVSGWLGAALLPTSGHMFPFLCHFCTSTITVSPQAQGEMLQGAQSSFILLLGQGCLFNYLMLFVVIISVCTYSCHSTKVFEVFLEFLRNGNQAGFPIFLENCSNGICMCMCPAEVWISMNKIYVTDEFSSIITLLWISTHQEREGISLSNVYIYLPKIS